MSDAQELMKPRALVVGHAGFASGLISAVDQISGRGWMLVGISNTGMTPDDIQAKVREYCEQGVRVVFTDLPGGSATICARRVSAEQNEMIIVSGVNLPALLDFVLSSELPAAGAEHAAARGREMIDVYGPR
jgi:mannose/fructose-specific phosphotransferase system component IIA